MKKFFLLFLSLIISTAIVLAESWDAFSDVDRMWDGQHSITNQEFEQVMDKLEEKGKLKEEKVQKKKRKKLFGSGTTLHDELNPDKEINEFESLEKKEDVLINLPVQIIIDGKSLEKGYYKVIGEKDSKTKKIYINFYQSQFFKGKLEMIETSDDYEKETIDFVDLIPYNEKFVKIIFGSLDFNAYAFVPFLE